MSKKNDDVAARPTCYQCFRPKTHCVCNLIPEQKIPCHTLILQHPAENKKYYSTVKLLSRSVPKLSCWRGETFPEEQLSHFIKTYECYLLYPGPEASDCRDITISDKSAVILLDGTWSQANKLYMLNPLLENIPKISFTTPQLSRYRIRKQPQDACLSTLESFARFLTEVQSSESEHTHLEQAARSLLEGFDKMVEQQLEHWDYS
jgi:DTW domain-containing protein YfiP